MTDSASTQDFQAGPRKTAQDMSAQELLVQLVTAAWEIARELQELNRNMFDLNSRVLEIANQARESKGHLREIQSEMRNRR
jgi:hypothetical protein